MTFAFGKSNNFHFFHFSENLNKILQFYFTIAQGVTLSTLEYIMATWERDRKRERRD